ncbi:hypothetical protein D3C87_2170100 [compost metagenome]
MHIPFALRTVLPPATGDAWIFIKYVVFALRVAPRYENTLKIWELHFFFRLTE